MHPTTPAPPAPAPRFPRPHHPLLPCLRLILALLLPIPATLPHTHAAELVVFAAASLSDLLRDLASDFQTATGTRVTFNFGASGLLARQIDQGAPADLFICADETQMDRLSRSLQPGSRTNLLTNTLVIILPRDSTLQLHRPSDLNQPGLNRIAIADPATAPAGTYARTLLERQGLWTTLAPRIIPLDNVRATLAAVASGNADAGIVYRTDATASPRVKVALRVPPRDHPPIVYPAAVLRASRAPAAASAFLHHIASDASRTILRKHGFIDPR